MNPSPTSAIHAELDRIEQDFQITCLLACESGSRAWGFASRDSDYDVRFVYFHALDWYLNVFEQRDVIELPIDSVLDINGWDLRKAMRLLWQSNPALLEWLSSPIVYRAHPRLGLLQRLAEQAFLPRSSCHHYLALARRYLDKLTAGGALTAKQYLYALRALLCCHWVIDHRRQPPMRFGELATALLPQGELRREIDNMLAEKSMSTEAAPVPRQPLLDDYLQSLISQLEARVPENPETRDRREFEKTFRLIIGAPAGGE